MDNITSSLLSSIVLFGRLLDHPGYTNIYDLIGIFIKAAVADAKTWSLNHAELTDLVNTAYGFQLPESVIHKTVRDTLKSDAVSHANGRYFFNPQLAKEYASLNTERARIMTIHREIYGRLCSFIEDRNGHPLTAVQKETACQHFNDHLLNRTISSEYRRGIAEFITRTRETTPGFTQHLTSIRVGLLVYHALRFNPDSEELYHWKTPLTIFLSTEHLFNALEYNGKHFLRLFNDFYRLVQEINNANKGKSQQPSIRLYYLQETRDEYTQMFDQAIAIINGEIMPDPDDPSRIAMEKLIKGCTSQADIQQKKANFEHRLSQLGIRLYEFDEHPYNYAEYMVDDRDTWQRIRETMHLKMIWPDDLRCHRLLRIFSIVNALRQGKRQRRLEEVRYCFLTNQRLALYLTHQTGIDFSDGSLPFAIDLGDLTNAIWTKLKKGFGEPLPRFIPTEFIAKTQSALPATLTERASDDYTNLLERLDQGDLSETTAKAWQLTIRSRPGESILPVHPPRHFEVRARNSKKEDLFQEMQEMTGENKTLKAKNAALEIENARFLALEKIRQEKALSWTEELKQKDLVDKGWQEKVTIFRKDAWYATMAIGISFVQNAFVAYAKYNPHWDHWLVRLGWGQYLIMLLSAGYTTFELAGRSYFFNKERIKNGRRWLWANRSKKAFAQLKTETEEELLRPAQDIKDTTAQS